MTIETTKILAETRLNSIFLEGQGLKSTALKRYSGKALEDFTEYVITLIIEDLKNQYPLANIEHSKDYIESDFEGLSRERADQHVKVNGKYVYIHEDRAWVDKPFYTLKRAVFYSMTKSCASKLDPNCQFGVLGFSLDYKPEIVNTFNHVFGMEDCIKTYNLTGRPRNLKVNGKSVNWFETGFQTHVLEQLITDIYLIIENAAKSTTA